MVSVAIFCMPKHAREAASCHACKRSCQLPCMPEKLPVAMHPEKLPVAMHPEKLPVAGSVGGRISVYRNGVLIWIITNLTMKN